MSANDRRHHRTRLRSAAPSTPRPAAADPPRWRRRCPGPDRVIHGVRQAVGPARTGGRSGLADHRRMLDHVDAVCGELLAIPDAGGHKQLRGVDGAAADQDELTKHSVALVNWLAPERAVGRAQRHRTHHSPATTQSGWTAIADAAAFSATPSTARKSQLRRVSSRAR